MKIFERVVRRVLNLGAGIQSTTLYLMFLRGEIQPQIECAIFADTGEEPSAVYRHLDWLQSLGGPPIQVRSIGTRLGDDLLVGKNGHGGRFASIPAYTASQEGQQAGKVRRQCTYEYKIRVIERFIRREMLGLAPRRRMPANVTVQQVYGISLDEAGRSLRIRERLKASRWIEPEFPLLDRGMTRTECVNWLAKFGVPHEVQKSACVFCPFKSNAEWRRLRDHDAEGWARAVQIDNALRAPGAGGTVRVKLEADVKTAIRFSILAVVVLALAGCAVRQGNPPTAPELNIARSLDALAHGANAVAKEIAVLKQQGRITPEETQAIAAWCRAVDIAVPRAFEVLKTSSPQGRASAVAGVLIEVARTGPLQDLIAKRGAQDEAQAAISLIKTALVIVDELVPEVPNGK